MLLKLFRNDKYGWWGELHQYSVWQLLSFFFVVVIIHLLHISCISTIPLLLNVLYKGLGYRQSTYLSDFSVSLIENEFHCIQHVIMYNVIDECFCCCSCFCFGGWFCSNRFQTIRFDSIRFDSIPVVGPGWIGWSRPFQTDVTSCWLGLTCWAWASSAPEMWIRMLLALVLVLVFLGLVAACHGHHLWNWRHGRDDGADPLHDDGVPERVDCWLGRREWTSALRGFESDAAPVVCTPVDPFPSGRDK